MVTFDYAKPNYEDKYRYIKAAKLEFNKSNCSLLFSKQFIDKPLASADDFSFQRAVLNCQKELDSYLYQHLSMGYRVKRVLKQNNGISLSLDDAALQLQVSKRSLHRSLESEGTSFKVLLRKIKTDRAVTLLQQGKTVTEVADLLNYSDCANFTRAFKTWFGIAPKEWIARDRITNAAK